MQNLRITTIQTTLHWENPTANLAMLEEKISSINDPTDVIVLPEMFTTGFSMNAQALAEPMNFHTTRWMKQMAAKTGALILGSLIIKEENKFFNRLIWMEPSGDFYTYDKRHLFRMADEDKIYSAGKNILIMEWKGWRICPLVCYDLRFPVWSRNRFDNDSKSLGYDVLIYVANWPAARSHHWQALLKARAIENLSYVVGVNRVGKDGKNVEYGGHTSITTAQGEEIYQAGSQEEIRTTELDAEALRNWRAKFPAYLDGDDFELSTSSR
jgi:omega-amidase